MGYDDVVSILRFVGVEGFFVGGVMLFESRWRSDDV